MPHSAAKPALLIALPDGLSVSGVTMWAVRLASALAKRGRRAGLLLHAEPPGQQRLDVQIDPQVRVWDLSQLGDLRAGGQTLAACVEAYARASREISGGDGLTVISPNLAGHCYGVAAGAARLDPERIRAVGWQHSDIPYDARVLEWYQDALSAFVGVSDVIAETLKTRLPTRATDVWNIGYGVDVGDELVRPVRDPSQNGPLKLIYTGRLEHRQKRVLALIRMSASLTARGIPHTLTIVGDGPASDVLKARTATLSHIRVTGAQPPRTVRSLLREHDAFVLPSRYEGLSVAMLEAMAEGCVPIVAGVRSGASQAIRHGENGLLAKATPEMEDDAAGDAMACAVAEYASLDQQALAHQAWLTVRDRFSLHHHTNRVEHMLDAVAAAASRVWPADRSIAFTGTVPPDGAVRVAAALKSLSGRKIIVHGTGAHTRALWPVIEASDVHVVALTDDDPQHHGTRAFDQPVIDPKNAHKSGATDVVISSWLHQDEIWNRREVYEQQGLAVHRLYL